MFEKTSIEEKEREKRAALFVVRGKTAYVARVKGFCAALLGTLLQMQL
jgi:hypothetical protein